MREIKHRAWSRGKMYRDVLLDSLNTYYLNKGIMNPLDDAIRMSFIGFKDLNDAEIYEGDIVRSGSMPASPIYLQNGRFMPVYADGSFDEWEGGIEKYNLEVIGNIYENPELLK